MPTPAPGHDVVADVISASRGTCPTDAQDFSWNCDDDVVRDLLAAP